MHKNLAFAFIDADFAEQSSGFSIDVIGEKVSAMPIDECSFDQKNTLMRR